MGLEISRNDQVVLPRIPIQSMLLSTDKMNDYQERSNPLLPFLAKRGRKNRKNAIAKFLIIPITYNSIKKATLHVNFFVIKKDRVRDLLRLLKRVFFKGFK